MLKILLIGKFPSALKKLNFPKFIIPIPSFRRTLLSSINSESYIQTNSKNNDFWIFLIFFVFSPILYLELETRVLINLISFLIRF